MRFNPVPLMAALLITHLAIAQEQQPGSGARPKRVHLKSGPITLARNIADTSIDRLNRTAARSFGVSHFLIQFDSIPSPQRRHALKDAGVELLEYIPDHAYLASVKGTLGATSLQRNGAVAVMELLPEHKMQPELARNQVPAWAIAGPDMVDVWISFPNVFSLETVLSALAGHNFNVVSSVYRDYRILELRVPAARLRELASHSFIEYVQAKPPQSKVLNDKSRTNTQANVLNASIPGGRNLKGSGVVVGVGDDSNPTRHIDFAERMINRAGIAGGSHGLHVMGTVAGGGIVLEKATGIAPKATIVAQAVSNILLYAPEYVTDHSMVITNNSYGNIEDECSSFGVYDLHSRVVDQQAAMLPHLQHVFAAGNSGTYSCLPYAAGFGNVLGSFQASKNAIMVGNVDENGLVEISSSKGPVRDGRIKPEVVALGERVYSTYPTNGYSHSRGTSMAAPSVSGGLALLYERYRQLHANTDPANGLMKALICNGATDRGNPGPDYSYGFGELNLLRSVKMLENNSYFSGSIGQGLTNTHSITIPSGISQLKVMLYWNDSAAAILSSHALVNDLDLEVVDASSTVHFPALLDTLPSQVGSVATTGPDRFNNIEQVVLVNPAAGTYHFNVKGSSVPLAATHDYFLVFDTIPTETVLTAPVGGERLADGDSIYINWESYGNPGNDFTLQFSTDNGSNWSNIAANIPATERRHKWHIPQVATEQAKVRLIHNGTGLQSTSEPFVILGHMVDSLVPVLQCEGYINMGWRPVAGATDYEVMMLRGDEMVPVAIVASSPYVFSGLSKDSVYWVSVRPRINGVPGRRGRGLSRQPVSGTCPGNISDNDLKIDAILSPVSGRMYTSTQLSNTASITIRIKNLDNAPTSGSIPVTYIIGNNPPVNEVISGPVIPALGTYTYTFSTTTDLSAIGTYQLKASVSYPSDIVSANDTMQVLVKQLDNPPIDLTTEFLDDLEAAAVQEHTSRQVGLAGLDRYDFVGSSINSRIRTFINTGIAYSGIKAITLDADRYVGAGVTDSLTATFNLGAYDVANDDIRLDFQYKQHGQLPSFAHNLWIRGDDQKPWILAYDLWENQEDVGVFKRSGSVELKNILAANSQNFSSSFQARWGQWGQYNTSDNESAAGYTFDDIHLYITVNDIQLVRIDTPIVAGCGLDANVPVTITVRNSASNNITNIPVRMLVDNNPVVTEVIPSIPANTNISYTFTAPANLAANGPHTIKVWVDLPDDSFRANDTAMVNPYNSPIVANYPYLQDFESGDGFWFASGKKSSWTYGTPASAKINGAASGTKAWKTGLPGNYNDGEFSYLYSPCFDISGLVNPMLSFNLALDLEDCGTGLCDAAFVEYSSDGKTWTRLGAMGSGTNWYNKDYGAYQVWSIENYTRWHVASIPLPDGLSMLRLRFVMRSDPYVSREGIAIDDIHIFDKQHDIYDGPPYTSAIANQPVVNGNNWINFTDAGKLIASIHPNGQNLGSTDVQAYIHTGPVRTQMSQYYHNRNITIKPTNTAPTDSVTIRFYFLETETEALINATGCPTCSKPSMVTQLGISKYAHANDAMENGTLADNSGGQWLFITADQARKVPYDNGYYAEFKVKDFSEFWLNNGGLNNNQPLPAELSSFTAIRNGRNTDLAWKTESEVNVSRYEVQVARGNNDYQQQRFIAIGEITGAGNSSGALYYSFVDEEPNKTGVHYYRLRIIDIDGRFTYSAVRPVVFDDEVKWQVYPNPSTGTFNIICQAPDGETVRMTLRDLSGRTVMQTQYRGSGFVQTFPVELADSRFAPGLYLLEVANGERKEVFRLLKQ